MGVLQPGDGGLGCAEPGGDLALGQTGGVTRLAFSREDAEARALVARWMADAGLAVHTDAATNTIGRTQRGLLAVPALTRQWPSSTLASHCATAA